MSSPYSPDLILFICSSYLGLISIWLLFSLIESRIWPTLFCC